MDTAQLVIRPVPPFDFPLTAGYLNHFQGRPGNNPVPQEGFRRLLDLDGSLVLATVKEEGDVDSPELVVDLKADSLTPELVDLSGEQLERMLGASQDLSPFYGMARKDPVMSELTRKFRGLHSPQTGSVFEALVLGIVGQQIAASVARNIRGRIIEAYGSRMAGGGELHLTFPRPAALAEAPLEDLRELKLSWRKAEYVKGIAAAADSGAFDRESLDALGDQEIVRLLVQLKGVGHWTAQWLLIRGLGRPNALPLGDLALRRVVSRLYFNGAPLKDQELEDFCSSWSPWRSYAVLYWFAALRSGLD